MNHHLQLRGRHRLPRGRRAERPIIRLGRQPEWLLALLFLATPDLARAQSIDELFPSGVAGYDQSPGVTVQTRQRSLYDEPGIRVPGFDIRPRFDQSLVYNSNPLGANSSGSLISQTAAGATAASTWSRNRLAATAGLNHVRYLDRPIDYTDFNIGISGGYTLFGQELAAAFSHQSFNTLGTTIATTRSTTPLLNQTDTARLSYTYAPGRLSLTPELTATAYRYGNATVSGITIDQQFLNHDVVTAGLTTRYAMTDRNSVLVVVRGIASHFINPQPGSPSLDSNSTLVLTGVDYQARGPWRYSLLIGGELRAFRAGAFTTQVTPILEGSVTWTPTGLTTLSGTATRTINDPQSGGTNGYTLTAARLRVDHEFMRNILLEGHAGIQFAEFLQGGTQTSTNIGGAVTRLLNRNLSLKFVYDYTRQSGSSITNHQPLSTNSSGTSERTGNFTQSLIGLTLKVRL